MELFKNDIINIGKILSIRKYTAPENASPKSYSTAPGAYKLIFFVSGGSDTHFCGVDIKDSPNSLRYIPKGDFAGNYTVENIKPGFCIDIYFDTCDPMPITAAGYQNMDILCDKFLKIYNIWSEKKPDYYVQSMMIFYDIIRAIKNHQIPYVNQNTKNKLSAAHEYILKNYKAHHFDYDALCDISGFGSSYFRQIFAATYHMSPVKYITKLKINYAKELLITKRYTITEIADLCGFDNVYYFSTVFKKITGITPKKFGTK